MDLKEEKKERILEFPGSPVVKIFRFHFWGHGFNPSLETKIPKAVWYGQNMEIKLYIYNKHTHTHAHTHGLPGWLSG